MTGIQTMLQEGGDRWETCHLPHMDLITAWRVEATAAKKQTWSAICPIQATGVFNIEEPGQYRWWRAHHEVGWF